MVRAFRWTLRLLRAGWFPRSVWLHRFLHDAVPLPPRLAPLPVPALRSTFLHTLRDVATPPPRPSFHADVDDVYDVNGLPVPHVDLAGRHFPDGGRRSVTPLPVRCSSLHTTTLPHPILVVVVSGHFALPLPACLPFVTLPAADRPWSTCGPGRLMTCYDVVRR